MGRKHKADKSKEKTTDKTFNNIQQCELMRRSNLCNPTGTTLCPLNSSISVLSIFMSFMRKENVSGQKKSKHFALSNISFDKRHYMIRLYS